MNGFRLKGRLREQGSRGAGEQGEKNSFSLTPFPFFLLLGEGAHEELVNFFLSSYFIESASDSLFS